MSDDHRKWEQACRKIRKENQQLLDQFANCLAAKGLGEKTIRDHVSNVDLYINEYLLYYEAIPAAHGVASAGEFFGDWFIRKAMWASENSIKKTATGLKKFYQFLFTLGRVKADDVQDLRDVLRDEMPRWLAALRRHDSASEEW